MLRLGDSPGHSPGEEAEPPAKAKLRPRLRLFAGVRGSGGRSPPNPNPGGAKCGAAKRSKDIALLQFLKKQSKDKAA